MAKKATAAICTPTARQWRCAPTSTSTRGTVRPAPFSKRSTNSSRQQWRQNHICRLWLLLSLWRPICGCCFWWSEGQTEVATTRSIRLKILYLPVPSMISSSNSNNNPRPSTTNRRLRTSNNAKLPNSSRSKWAARKKSQKTNLKFEKKTSQSSSCYLHACRYSSTRHHSHVIMLFPPLLLFSS